MLEKARLFENYCDWLYGTRLRQPFLQVSKEDILNDGLIIYGFDVWGKYALECLAQQGIEPDWIVDRNESLYGKGGGGIDIRPPSSLSSAKNRYVLLMVTHIRDLADTCMAYGATKWILSAAIADWCPMIGDFGICSNNANTEPALKNAYQLMADDKSREVFRAFLRWHYTFDSNFASLCDPVQYFPEDLRDMIDYSFFIDAGAYNGDTLQDWLGVVGNGGGGVLFL
jgi:hypothetical protein